MDMRTPSAAAGPLFSDGYKRWLLTLLLLIQIFNIMDRIVMSTLGQAIKIDLRITDFQLGILQGLAFSVLYAVLGLPVARLAERTRRTAIISAAIAIWSAMTALCGLAANFTQFLIFRIGVGVGDTGFGPPVASLLGDHFPPAKRGSAVSIMMLGVPIGSLLGAVIGGWIAEHLNWRLAFVIVGAPGLVLAAVAALTMREPPRGYSEGGVGAAEPVPSTWTTVRYLFAKPTFRHLMVGSVLASFGTMAIGQFLHPYLVRVYHMGYAEAGLIFGSVSAVSLTLGLMLGGFGTERLLKRDRRWHAWVPAIGVFLAAPAYAIGFSVESALVATLCFALAGMCLFVNVGPTAAMAQNMVGTRMRASAAYVAFLLVTLLGAGLGPTVLGLLSDLYARHAFTLGEFALACPGGTPAADATAAMADACRAASATGIRNAFITVCALFLWSALHYLLAARTLVRDLYIAAPLVETEAGGPVLSAT